MTTEADVYNALKYHVEVDSYGTRRYYNSADQLHREDGPAVEWPSGAKHWYQNGKLHREDGPAVEMADGSKFWHQNGKLHREDGPAIIWHYGARYWFLHGVEYTKNNHRRKCK